MRRQILTALLVVACAGSAEAETTQAVLRFHFTSFVDQASPGANGVYFFPAGGELDIVFGEATEGVLSLSVPKNGMRVYPLEKEGLPTLELTLAAPGSGQLALSGADKGALLLDVEVVVRATARPPVHYRLRFSTEPTPLVEGQGTIEGRRMDATGSVELVTSAAVKDDRVEYAGDFFAILSGQFSPVPAELQ